jgi:ABC-type uncharacterized transport system auxiliary subunit
MGAARKHKAAIGRNDSGIGRREPGSAPPTSPQSTDAAAPRFYRPAPATLDGDPPAAAAAPQAASTPVRLGPVTATPFLRERIAWRSSMVEYGLCEQRRWSETPPRHVQRALESAPHATPGLRLTDAFEAPALRVDVVALDDVLAPEHVARVELVLPRRDRSRARLLDRTFSAEAPVASDDAAASATAMGAALDRAVAEVAGTVATALRASAQAPPAGRWQGNERAGQPRAKRAADRRERGEWGPARLCRVGRGTSWPLAAMVARATRKVAPGE